jgi:twitching motility protein PilT
MNDTPLAPSDSIEEKLRSITDFVRSQPVSDISLYDTHITARYDGAIYRLSEEGALTKREIQDLINHLAKGNFLTGEDPRIAHDFTVELFGKRFRINIARSDGSLFASMRPLPDFPPSPSELALPAKLMKHIANLRDGLVLVTGPTGSGKTSTIAAFVESINESRPVKIVTIEDPIEFRFKSRRAEIIQREVGRDTPSYDCATRESLRQNPDVIVIGEIRDRDTAVAALQAAETGHLVIGSLHATSVVETVSRYLLLCPSERSTELRYVLARAMRVLINQRLFRRRGGGRLAVREICLHAPKVEALILKGNEQELVSHMLAGRESGMIDFQSALKAVQHQVDPEEHHFDLRQL